MSRLRHQMGLGALRVRGMKTVHYTTLLRALGLNVLRCAASGAFSTSRIAEKLNNRPRKRIGFKTPKECYEKSDRCVALQT